MRAVGALYVALLARCLIFCGGWDTVKAQGLEDRMKHLQNAQPLQPAAQLRSLQAHISVNDTFVVTTPLELFGALEQGARHIEIREHLDLTTLQPRGRFGLNAMLTNDFIDRERFSWSIRGNCSHEPTAEQLPLYNGAQSEWKPGQCVILTDVELVELELQLWLDNLYIRHVTTPRTDTVSVLWCVTEMCQMWMTSVTIQGDGDGDPSSGALWVTGGLVYAEGLVISDFDSRTTVLHIGRGGTVSLQGSEIHRNVVTSTSGGSLVSVESVDPFHQNVDHGTILRLEACDLEDNSVPHILMAFSNADSDDLEVQIYSDLAREVHNVRSNTTSVGTLPLTVGVDGSQDINSTSPWFSNAQQDYDRAQKSPAPASKAPVVDQGAPVHLTTVEASLTSSPNQEGEEKHLGKIAVLIAVVVGLITTIVFAISLFISRRSRQGSASGILGGNGLNSSRNRLLRSTQSDADGFVSARNSTSTNACESSASSEANLDRPVTTITNVWIPPEGLSESCSQVSAPVTGAATITVHDSSSHVNSRVNSHSTYAVAAVTASSDDREIRTISEFQGAAASGNSEASASCMCKEDIMHGTELSKSSETMICSQSECQFLEQQLQQTCTSSQKQLHAQHAPAFGHACGYGYGNAYALPNNMPHSKDVSTSSRSTPSSYSAVLGAYSQYHFSGSGSGSGGGGRGIGSGGAGGAWSSGGGGSVSQQYQLSPLPSSRHGDVSSEVLYTAESLMRPPDEDAPLNERMEFLHQQLDSLGVTKPAVGDLVLLGRGGCFRRQGGQAIVQVARGQHTRIIFAIKFFVSKRAFRDEQSIYSPGTCRPASDLQAFLPEVYGVYDNENNELVDAHGYALPPCIVMERGESLDIWTARAKPDRLQACMMISHLASRLRDLHALGYVHRDLKPGNVMWLPRQNRWTIIDFGCVARTGKVARLGFTHAYAAPEVLAAYRSGARTMIAKVMDRIEGLNGLSLPWEGSLPPAKRRMLGNLTDHILKLLSRNPDNRPSAEAFFVSCNQVLAGTSSVHL